MSNIKHISERVSYKDHGDKLTVIISSKIERWKEGLLIMWLLGWTFSGAYFAYELFTQQHDDNMKIALVIMLSFWVFFEVRIGKALLWRKYGMEFLKLEDGQLFIKNSIKGYGKSLPYFCANIKNIHLLDKKDMSPLAFLENSFWFVGGETIGFYHKDKLVKLGKQLSKEEAKKLVAFLKKNVK